SHVQTIKSDAPHRPGLDDDGISARGTRDDRGAHCRAAGAQAGDDAGCAREGGRAGRACRRAMADAAVAARLSVPDDLSIYRMAVFEWDTGKAGRNVAKHGVDFDEAASVFDDPAGLDGEDIMHSASEPRRLRLARSR